MALHPAVAFGAVLVGALLEDSSLRSSHFRLPALSRPLSRVLALVRDGIGRRNATSATGSNYWSSFTGCSRLLSECVTEEEREKSEIRKAAPMVETKLPTSRTSANPAVNAPSLRPEAVER